MWWQKREYEAGCWVFSHPQKIPFFSTPYEGSSLRIPNYYWPRRKMMMSLHSSSFVSTLNGYHHAIVRVKSTKNHHWDSICGPQRLCSISGPTTTDALTQFFPCIPRFFGFNWPCQFHFFVLQHQWHNNGIIEFSCQKCITYLVLGKFKWYIVDLRTLWELLF